MREHSTDARWDGIRRIWAIIDELRGEPGCPWDRKQTPASVQTYLVEEAHEAAAAIRAGDSQEAAGELGDVLFMVLFLIHLYEEGGAFRLEEVCELISDKMIRRHPHVFGDATAASAGEVRDNWERIKAGEKQGGQTDAIASIPDSLPALVRAYRIQSRLAQRNPEAWNSAEMLTRRFLEDSRSLVQDLLAGVPVAPERVGSLLFLVVGLARLRGFRPEDCLHLFLNEFHRGDASEK